MSAALIDSPGRNTRMHHEVLKPRLTPYRKWFTQPGHTSLPNTGSESQGATGAWMLKAERQHSNSQRKPHVYIDVINNRKA